MYSFLFFCCLIESKKKKSCSKIHQNSSKMFRIFLIEFYCKTSHQIFDLSKCFGNNWGLGSLFCTVSLSSSHFSSSFSESDLTPRIYFYGWRTYCLVSYFVYRDFLINLQANKYFCCYSDIRIGSNYKNLCTELYGEM